MAAVYPVSVRTFTPHKDSVEFVFADHVNALQDEVSAIEKALGALPQNMPSPGAAGWPTHLTDLRTKLTWNNVADRMASFQRHIVDLERRMNALTSSGHHLTPGRAVLNPVALLRCLGQTFTPSVSQWRSYDLSVAEFDSDGMFSGGNNVACPQTGWWNITASMWTDVPQGPVGTVHRVSNRMILGTQEVAAHSSEIGWGSGGQHLINLAYSGPWTVGDRCFIQINQYPTPASADVWSQMRVGFTFVRETV